MRSIIVGVMVSMLSPAPAPLVVDPLPTGWRADIGIPVELSSGRSVYLYGDTFGTEHVARNTAVLDGVAISPALRDTAAGTWYWPSDAVELPDGSLFVLAAEVIDDGSELGFDLIDTDAFIVSEPLNPMAWRWADKLEEGPWAELQVQFLDQYPMLVARDAHGFESTLYEYDPDDPMRPWVELPAELPTSFGVFAPVQTDLGWFGWTWEMWHEATLWHAEELTGSWSVVSVITTADMTYDHGLNIVAGRVLYRWSNGDGSQRPTYVDVTDQLLAGSA